jgi:Glycosyl transferases group 1
MEKARLPEFGIEGESIICFAGEDWWYHNPHSKNHIVKRLARQNKVLFVNSLTMGMPPTSNPDFFKKVWRKLRSFTRGVRKVSDGLWVMTPIVVPLYGSRLGRTLNRLLLILQLRVVMLALGMRRPIVWAAIPTAADIVDHLGARLLVYQVSDKYDSNEESVVSADVIRRMDKQLKERAAAIMFSGRKLYEESDAPHRYFLEQAVDFDHFAVPAAETAPDIAAIPRPVLGYVGAIDMMMDAELIEKVARLRPDWHWVFIGGASKMVQVNAPNVHFLGARKYADLPKYYRHIDVCVQPWIPKNVFSSYGSSIKVREYLATGKPVVMSPLYEYRNTPGIRMYESPEEFVHLVEEALTQDTPEQRALRQNFVQNCTWDVRSREVGLLFDRLLRGEMVTAPASTPQRVALS